MPVKDQVSQRTCECGRSLEGRRANAETCSDACRIKKHRRDNPPIPAGPLLFFLINTYQRKLKAKTAKAREGFAPIAKALTPLAHRRLLTVSREEWEAWLIAATPVMAESTRTLWRRYLRAAFKPNPHFLAAPPPRPARPPVDRATSHALLLSSERMPKAERPRLVVELIAGGLYPKEIQTLTVTPTGELEAGPAAWGRRSRPEIPHTLESRIMAYASAMQIPAGAPVFPISSQAIRRIISRWLPRQTPCSTSVAVSEET